MSGNEHEQGTLARTVLWQRVDAPGTEYSLIGVGAGTPWILHGIVNTLFADKPSSIRYDITCDDSWRTAAVMIWMTSGLERSLLRFTCDEEKRWWREVLLASDVNESSEQAPAELTTLRGCVDVDLGCTPATNTLPIRRLNLAVGESAEVTAAWVRFPSLTIEPLAQTYTRLDVYRYRYESATGFSAELTVDELGIVVHYPGGWERVAAVDSAPRAQ